MAASVYSGNSFELRYIRPPQDLDGMVRHTLEDIDQNRTIIDLHSLDYQVSGNSNQER